MEVQTSDWNKFADIASRFDRKAYFQDREDLNHNIIVRLAELTIQKGNLSLASMLRIASYVVQEYWHSFKKTSIEVCIANGTAKPRNWESCTYSHKPNGNCRSYIVIHHKHIINVCPYLAYRPAQSLDMEITDGEGNVSQLWEVIADDKAIDLDAWIDSRTSLLGLSRRLVNIAVKLQSDKPVTKTDMRYLERYRKNKKAIQQKSLF